MTSLTSEQKCAVLMAKQYGLISITQARDAGLTRAAIRWKIRSGEWKRVRPRVFLANTHAWSWHAELLANCLQLGRHAAVSHASAAALWGIDGFKPGPVVLSVPKKKVPSIPGALIYSNAALATERRTTRGGIPVTNPERTLHDLAATESSESTEWALEYCLKRKWTSVRRLKAFLSESVGRLGAKVLRELLALHDEGGKSDSRLETRLLRFLRERGLPKPVQQYILHEADEFIARLDFAYPEHKIAIETDGRLTHTRRAQFDLDHVRRNYVQCADWRVLVVTSEQLRIGRDELERQFRVALRLDSPVLTAREPEPIWLLAG
jgi:very-short-patch-repair endonuclease